MINAQACQLRNNLIQYQPIILNNNQRNLFMVQLKIIAPLTAENVTDTLRSDLNTVSEKIKSGIFSVLEPVSANLLASQLKSVLALANGMEDKKSSDELKKLLRHFIFLLEKYDDKLVFSQVSAHSAKLHQTILKISSAIGVTPRLNTHVKLPRVEFLPVRLNSSKAKWKEKPCLTPSRSASSIDQGKISFFSRDGKNAVRTELKAQLKGKKLAMLGSGSDAYALNLVDHEYYQIGLLDADHLLPASNINARLQEMIEMMNYDPTFRAEMESSPFNDDYFVLQGHKVVGNYWLYMSYHNAMQNLWFLLSSDNSGDGKVASDPLVWLETQDIGQEYLESLRCAGKSIDRSGILYIVRPDNHDLKDSFVSWVENSEKRLVRFCNQFAQFHHAIRDEMDNAINAGVRHRGHRETGVKLRRTAHVVTHKDTDESSLSGNSSTLGSEDFKEIEDRTMRDLEENAEYQDLEKRMSEIERSALRDNKRKFVDDKPSNSSSKLRK